MSIDNTHSQITNFVADKQIEGGAKSTYAKYGEITKKGGKKERLKLSEDSRFHIAFETIKTSGGIWNKVKEKVMSITHYFTHIKVKEGDQTFFFNVGSIGKRLHLSRKQLKEARDTSTLVTKLKLAHEIASVRAEKFDIVEEGKSKITEYFNKKNYRLKSAELKEIDTLFKTIVQSSDKSKGYEYVDPSDSQRVYTVGFDKNKQKIEVIFIQGLLNKDSTGSYGEVRQVENLLAEGGKSTDVVKLARTDFSSPVHAKIAKADVRKEGQILTHIHEQGQRIGIQKAPKYIVEITNPEKVQESRNGYLTQKYDSDYFTTITTRRKPGAKEIYSEFYQLILGLGQLHGMGIVHGDIKPENMLVKSEKIVIKKGEEMQFKETVISDLGASVRIDKQTSLKDLELRGTASYISYNDKIKAEALVRGNDKDKEDLIALRKKADVFSLGVVFYQVLTLQPPFSSQIGLYPDPRSYVSLSKHGGLGDIDPNLLTLVENMLDNDYTQRPTMDQALSQFKTIVGKKDPQLLKELDKIIVAKYPGTKIL